MLFPDFDPIAFSIGPLVVRWYALAYIVGLIGGWRLCMALARRYTGTPKAELFDDFLTWAVVGVIFGGRLGYVLFYNLEQYVDTPLEIIKVWHGGMSFHGGMLGVILATYLFTRTKKIPFFAFSDILACVTPLGLGFGRLANFVNGELYGRETTVPWGIVFPNGGPVTRHPSQLYEAALEGILLFVTMLALVHQQKIRAHKGLLSGLFLILYGLLRFGIEFFREPDPQLGFLFAGATMGQILCIPMVIAGSFIVLWSLKKHPLKLQHH